MQGQGARIESVDALRGFAAFYVLLFHASGYLPASGISPSLHYGVEAVLLFFVVSGLCIHLAAASRLNRVGGKFDLRSYAGRRFWRIYPTFFMALLLTAACDRAGGIIDPALYRNMKIAIGAGVSGVHTDLTAFITNMLCLQPQVPVFGTNGPLWSLGYESFYYAIYPVLFVLLRTYKAAVLFSVSLALSLVSATIFKYTGLVLPFHFLALWVIWVAGAGIAEIVARAKIGRLYSAALPIGLLFLSAAIIVKWPSATMGMWIWGGAFAALVLWLIQADDFGARAARKFCDMFRFTGKFSYSLYLVQAPILALTRALFDSGYLPLKGGLSQFLVAILISLIFALAFYWAVERHFDGRIFHFSRRFPYVRSAKGAAQLAVEHEEAVAP